MVIAVPDSLYKPLRRNLLSFHAVIATEQWTVLPLFIEDLHVAAAELGAKLYYEPVIWNARPMSCAARLGRSSEFIIE